MSDEHSKSMISAAHAHTNLNIFHAIIVILEGGTIYGGSGSAQRTAATIIELCKAEGARQLTAYDRARNA